MNGGLLTDDSPECPRCDAVNWNDDDRLTCNACGYTPRASVREAIREVLER